MTAGSNAVQPGRSDVLAKRTIAAATVAIFGAVAVTMRVKLHVHLGFNPTRFADASAAINATVAVLLVVGRVLIAKRKREAHRKTMLVAMGLSVLFLLFYVGHHLFTGEAHYAGPMRGLYLTILASHIILAGVVLPAILWAAYLALSKQFARHRRVVGWTWPVWLYVAVTGVVVYFMVRPYY